MTESVHELRPKGPGPKLPESEKVTVNLGFVDLGRVDLMVRDGFYANRADFIRTAVRNQLDRQEEALRQSVARRQLSLGLTYITRAELEAARDSGTPSASRSSGSPASPTTSRRSSPGRPSRRSTCSAPSMPAPPSRPRSPTASPETPPRTGPRS